MIGVPSFTYDDRQCVSCPNVSRERPIMSEHAQSTMNNTVPDDPASESDNAIRLYVPPRLLVLTGVCGLTGASLGLMRGSRAEGMRFLAENAHRAPTTLQGWYMYKKTKNYRMMWGGLKAGGRDALRLGAVGACFAAVEDGIGRIGDARESAIGEGREAGAGLITAGMFCALCKF